MALADPRNNKPRSLRSEEALAHIHPGGLLDVDLDLGLRSSADFAHAVNLSTSALSGQLDGRVMIREAHAAHLLVLAHLRLEGHSGIEGEDETDGVGLALKALENSPEEGRGCLSCDCEFLNPVDNRELLTPLNQIGEGEKSRQELSFESHSDEPCHKSVCGGPSDANQLHERFAMTGRD